MGRNPSRIDWTVPHRITGPAWNFLQAVFTGCSFLQSFHLFWHRLDCSVDTCSTMALHKLQGNLYSCPSSSLFIALWFSHILLLLSPGAAAWHFLSFPKYFIKVLLISLTASDLASGRSLWDLGETGFAWHGARLWHLLTEPIPSVPPSKLFHTNPMQVAARVSHDNK